MMIEMIMIRIVYSSTYTSYEKHDESDYYTDIVFLYHRTMIMTVSIKHNIKNKSENTQELCPYIFSPSSFRNVYKFAHIYHIQHIFIKNITYKNITVMKNKINYPQYAYIIYNIYIRDASMTDSHLIIATRFLI